MRLEYARGPGLVGMAWHRDGSLGRGKARERRRETGTRGPYASNKVAMLDWTRPVPLTCASSKRIKAGGGGCGPGFRGRGLPRQRTIPVCSSVEAGLCCSTLFFFTGQGMYLFKVWLVLISSNPAPTRPDLLEAYQGFPKPLHPCLPSHHPPSHNPMLEQKNALAS